MVHTYDGGENGGCPCVSACRSSVTGGGGCALYLYMCVQRGAGCGKCAPTSVCQSRCAQGFGNPQRGETRARGVAQAVPRAGEGLCKAGRVQGGCWHHGPSPTVPSPCRKLYWTDGDNISVANMDGSNRTLLFTNQKGPVGMDPSMAPRIPHLALLSCRASNPHSGSLWGWQLSCAGSP